MYSRVIKLDRSKRNLFYTTHWDELLETLGVAIFGIGILNIILETNGWRNYFEDRLKHIVIDHSYLTSLDDGTLRGIQTGVFKALFGDKSIDREGSFLEYFDSNLHKYIGAPYREDVTTEIFCKSHDENRWKISQRVTYTCRRSAKGIQDDVRWGPGVNEKIDVKSVEIKIRYPYNLLKQLEKTPDDKRILLRPGDKRILLTSSGEKTLFPKEHHKN